MTVNIKQHKSWHEKLGQATKFKDFIDTNPIRSNTVIDNANHEHLYGTCLSCLKPRRDLRVTNFLHILGFQVII
jgi:hypothetical protein